ncbi:MAG: helix-turn-helix transcriptional regulator [Kiritimatiellae bacterium]|nr:helix-turn-helix transcriptional regulator [Kiritimatiellia bacterium]
MTQIFGNLTHNTKVGCPPWETFCLLSRAGGFFMAAHAHSYLQLIHVLDGEFEVEFGSGWILLRKGDVHLLPAGCSHALRSRNGYAQFGLNFSAAPDERGLLAALTGVFAQPAVFRMPFREAWGVGLEPPAVRRSQSEWLRMLNALDDYSVALLETRGAHSRDSRTQRLLDYLGENLHRSVSVDEAARALHHGRATLQRLCRRHFQCGLAHLHERLRLDRAADRLLRTDASISECAFACGYADVYHFSRAFKRVNGVSPRAYRRAQREALA